MRLGGEVICLPRPQRPNRLIRSRSVPEKVAEVRHFLYLDDRLVKEFVAQLEEGELDQLDYQSATEGAGRTAGRLGMSFARLEATDETAEREALTYSLRLSPPSRFQRLTRLLQEHKALAVDPSDLARVAAGAFAIVECDVALTGLSKLALGFRDLERSARFFGQIPQSASSQRVWFLSPLKRLGNEFARRRQIANWRKLKRTTSAMEGDTVPIIGRSTAQHQTKVLARLRRDSLQVPIHELEGRARLLVKVVRQVVGDEVVDAADVFPGARSLTTAFRQGIQASDARALVGEMSVAAPATVVTAVAVYR